MWRCLKEHTRGMKCNRTSNPWMSANLLLMLMQINMSYPIILSYCCCRIFAATLQSTCPVLKVMANASAMSCCIDIGIAGFLFAGPTHTSVEPLCSNSLAPNCVISAPDTNERTTFVGKRCSKCDSTPSVCVVLTRMHVCWGVTTDSMTAARS